MWARDDRPPAGRCRPRRRRRRRGETSPAVTVPRCTRSPATGDCTSSTRTVNDAAAQHARVGLLATGLGVERACGRAPPRPVARAGGRHRARRRRAARRPWPRRPARCSRGTRCRRACRAPRGRSTPSPWPTLRLAASALARVRCSCISARNRSWSTVQPGLGGHLQRQVDREAVRVVQLERLVARQHGCAGLLASPRPRCRRSASPAVSVARKASSSARTTAEIRSKSVASSG